MKKVTQEELKEVQDLRDSLYVITSTIGELHLTRMMLQKEIESVDNNIKSEEQKFTDFQQQERVIYNKLQEKYGAGNIDLSTGEITV